MMNPFTSAGAIAILLSNDFWYMHLYSRDEDFDKSHELTEKYYNILSSEADSLMELTLQEGYPIVHPSEVKDFVPDWQVENQQEYSYFDVVTVAKAKLSLYTNALRKLREFTNKSEIQSRIDSILEWWGKEVDYKLTRRTSTPSLLNGFVNTGLDNALAYAIGGNHL